MKSGYKIRIAIIVLLTTGLLCPIAFAGTTSRFNMPAKKLFSLVLEHEKGPGNLHFRSNETELTLDFMEGGAPYNDHGKTIHACVDVACYFYYVSVIPDSENTSTLQVEVWYIGPEDHPMPVLVQNAEQKFVMTFRKYLMDLHEKGADKP